MNKITLRDHFAGLAMQGILAMDDDIDFKYISSVAYSMADAMIKERNSHLTTRHEELCDNKALKELCNGDD